MYFYNSLRTNSMKHSSDLLKVFSLSKLRKREDSSAISRTSNVQDSSVGPVVVTSNGYSDKQNAALATSPGNCYRNMAYRQSSVSIDRPSSYSPEFLYTAGNSQTSLNITDQETLVHPSLPSDEHSKKNLKGKLRKLVKRKNTHEETYALPVELREQLKQIYVY